MTWPRQRLESLAADEPYSLVGGPFGSKLTSGDYVDEGVPVIRGSNFSVGRFLGMDNFVYVSESKVREDLSSNLAKPRDLVFTQRGTLGQVALIPEDGISEQYVVSQSQMKLTVNDAKADRLFLYYYFSSREAVARILNLTSSSGVPHINLTMLRGFEVPTPPLQTQRAIASILSAYDDLIENNRRRIELLEQAARLLYEEWFVRFRFPGHEHVEIVGGLPTGWKRRILADLCDEIRDTMSPGSLEPETPYIGLEHMPRRSISLNEWGKAEQVTSTKHRFRQGDILFGKIRPYFHKVGITLVDGVASSDAIVIRPRDATLHGLVLMVVSSDRFVATTAQTMREGSKMPRADWKQMRQWVVPIPPTGLLHNFQSVVQSIVDQLGTLSLSIHSLRAAADLLLPKLMNGEIAV